MQGLRLVEFGDNIAVLKMVLLVEGYKLDKLYELIQVQTYSDIP